MEQVRGNPTCNESFSISTYVFASTGASGTVTASGGVSLSALERGQSIFLNIGAGTSGGFTSNGEYYIIPGTSGAIQIATSRANAMISSPDLTASGDAGSGTIYPNYKVGGTLFCGTSGNANIRGTGHGGTGTTSFSLHQNIGDGSSLPWMIESISSSGSTVGGLVKWVR